MFELEAWGEASVIVSGLMFLAARSPFARAFELQLAIWGAGDAAAASFDLLRSKRDKSLERSPAEWDGLARDRAARHRLAALIAGLLGAAALGVWRLGRGPRLRGTAAGIALQCAFLTVFNLLASLVFRA